MQIGSNYIIFLEQACELFKAVGQGLPRYQEIQESCRQYFQPAHHDKLVLLSYAYADIIRFCLELYCMFSRGSHGMSSYVQKFVSPKTSGTSYISTQPRVSRSGNDVSFTAQLVWAPPLCLWNVSTGGDGNGGSLSCQSGVMLTFYRG